MAIRQASDAMFIIESPRMGARVRQIPPIPLAMTPVARARHGAGHRCADRDLASAGSVVDGADLEERRPCN